MLKNKNVRSLLLLLAGNSGANLVYMVCLFIMGAVLVPQDFAHFRVAYAYLAVASSISLLGLNTSLVKYLPDATPDERYTQLKVTFALVMSMALIAGAVAYMLMPFKVENPSRLFYVFAFPLAVMGSVVSNNVLSVLQAMGQLEKYSLFQFQWKTVILTAALIGALIGGGVFSIIFMSFSYLIVCLLLLRLMRVFNEYINKNKAKNRNAVRRMLIGGLWPFASIIVSSVYGNIEFLFITPMDVESGLAGSYSLASLIYLGGAAFFFPFQTYAVSKVVGKKISAKGLWKLQAICFGILFAVTIVVAGVVHVLNEFQPLKFDANFVNFSYLVSIKLLLWSGYSVTGAVLYYVGKEFESFLLTVLVLLVMLIIPYVLGLTMNLKLMVYLQLVSGFVILIGSSFLFSNGFSKYTS